MTTRETTGTTPKRPLLPGMVYLGGLITWFVTFLVLFALSEIDCGSTRLAFDLFGVPAVRVIGIAVTLVASFTALAAGQIALLNSRGAEPANDRPFAVAFGGMINGFFVIAILLTGLPYVLLRTCS